ncbi:MAG TPA: hypothetical protein VGQ83_08520 [Polyangia bacterium]|jgi:hypothetical protein
MGDLNGRAARLASRGFIVGALVALSAGCAPDLPVGTVPTYAVMQFDPQATPPRISEPTVLAINQQTGLIDFSASGVNVPADCATAPAAAPPETAMPVAACEFYTFLQSLDGFPTVTPGRTPASEPLDVASVTVPENLFIYNRTKSSTYADVTVSYDETANYLVFNPNSGWDVDSVYTVAVRGYANGVKAVSGHEVIGTDIYFFLKSDESLTCGASAPPVDPSCAYYGLVARPGQTPDEISATLLQLEQLRQAWLLFGVFDDAATKGNMPKDEVAIAWSFPTHSASVVELLPPLLVPEVVGTNQLKLKVKGSIKASTLGPFSLQTPEGSVVLLDLTVLAENPGVFPPPPEAVPPFTPTYENGAIVLTAATDLIVGHQYGILLLTRITNEAGKPIVPSPLTVMLKASGELIDAAGHSQVPNVDDASAAAAEAGRVQLKPLLDQLLPLVLLTRADIAYMYAFTYPNP